MKDMKKVASLTEKEKSRTVAFSGKVFDVAVCEAELPDGTVARRDIMVHSGGVCVVAIDPAGDILMVRQYRYGAGKSLLELPAGKLEAGESPEQAIRRELLEETGYTAAKFQKIATCYSSPAISTEEIHIYLAVGSIKNGKQKLDGDEFLSVEKHPMDEAVKLIESGVITDAKTQIGILRARMFLGK